MRLNKWAVGNRVSEIGILPGRIMGTFGDYVRATTIQPEVITLEEEDLLEASEDDSTDGEMLCITDDETRQEEGESEEEFLWDPMSSSYENETNRDGEEKEEEQQGMGHPMKETRKEQKYDRFFIPRIGYEDLKLFDKRIQRTYHVKLLDI